MVKLINLLSFVFILNCLLVSTKSYAFVNGLTLLKKEDRAILLIADRHIETQHAPNDLLQKELNDIKSAKKFIQQLVALDLTPTWILESSNLSLKYHSLEAGKSELLYALPNEILRFSKTQQAQYILADNRRDGIKDIFLYIHTLQTMVAQEFIDYLQNKPAKSVQEQKAWNSILNMPMVSYLSLAPLIEIQVINDKEFKQIFLNAVNSFLTRSALAKEFNLPLKNIEDSLLILKKEFQILLGIYKLEQKETILEENELQIENCHAELNSYTTATRSKNSDSFAKILLKQIQKSPSLKILEDFVSGDLKKCFTLLIADFGFLSDSLNDQKQNKISIAYAGGNHIHYIEKHLLNIGYQIVFQEGSTKAHNVVSVMNHWNEYDTPIEQKLLDSRFQQTVNVFEKLKSPKNNKDEF